MLSSRSLLSSLVVIGAELLSYPLCAYKPRSGLGKIELSASYLTVMRSPSASLEAVSRVQDKKQTLTIQASKIKNLSIP